MGICREGTCHNLQGSFQCVCPPGFTLNPTRDTCVDVDECSGFNPCNNGSCINQIGSYRCHCHDGYKLSPNNICVGEYGSSNLRISWLNKHFLGSFHTRLKSDSLDYYHPVSTKRVYIFYFITAENSSILHRPPCILESHLLAEKVGTLGS